MIHLEHIQDVRNRIAEIESQFGVGRFSRGAEFGRVLAEKMRRQGVEVQETDGAVGSKQTKATPKAAAEPIKTVRSVSDLKVADENLTNLVEAAAKKYRVDPKLVSAVAEVESGGSQSAVSSAGAIGVMQLMPDTAAALGVDPFDKAQNVEGGAKYLRQMLDAFNGDVKKAVAAYNAGPTAVRNYGGVPPYRETQNYVNKVLDIYR